LPTPLHFANLRIRHGGHVLPPIAVASVTFQKSRTCPLEGRIDKLLTKRVTRSIPAGRHEVPKHTCRRVFSLSSRKLNDLHPDPKNQYWELHPRSQIWLHNHVR